MTPADVKKFLKEITAGRKITRKEMRTVKSILNGIFSLAMDEGAITFKPALQVKTNDLKCKAVRQMPWHLTPRHSPNAYASIRARLIASRE